MIECSSCGNHLGHLMQDYLNMSKQLMRDIVSADNEYETLLDLLQDNKDKYEYEDGNISEFLTTYYTWAKDHVELDLFNPSNLVARALLAMRPLDASHLPFGQLGPDGQRNSYEARICCMTAFQCTPLSDATF